MNESVETYLALLLFLPWFAILGALFWWYPRQPRGAARRAWDIASLLAATLVFLVALRWALDAADPSYGRMWRQIFATSVGYGLFLAALSAAFLLRRRWLSRHRTRGA